jgi:hypothetical protein
MRASGTTRHSCAKSSACVRRSRVSPASSRMPQYSLATKMASTVDEVISFLEELAARSQAAGQREFAQLESHAGRELEAWDVAWVAEQVRRERFDISDEMLRPYFPLERVVGGMFALVERLFGIRVRADDAICGWHEDARFYVLEDETGTRRGGFYVDLFARPRKRGGAWMDECVVRSELDGAVELPVAYLVCNFTPASGGSSGAALARRGGHVVPRVRSQPAPHADARRLPEPGRHQRRAVGRGRAAQSVPRELRLDAGGHRDDLRPCRHRRAAARRDAAHA